MYHTLEILYKLKAFYGALHENQYFHIRIQFIPFSSGKQ